jgi:adenylate cyclase
MIRGMADDADEAAGRPPPLDLDIALHEGEVTYGNVGTEDRLDFTVIGRAVNEARRLEGPCKELGLLLLVSDWFASRARGAGEGAVRGAA